MKLILITPEIDPNQGGVGRYLSDLYSKLPADKVRVIHDPKILSQSIFVNIWRFIKLMSPRDAILHVSHILPLGTAAALAGFIRRRPYVVSLHGMDFMLALEVPRRRRLAKWILKRAQLVTTNSETLQKMVLKFQPKANTIVIYPSLPTISSVNFEAPHENKIVFLGRLMKRKGADLAIRALALLPGYQLLIAGEGPERASLEALSRELSLSDRVKFLGSISESDKTKLFEGARAFVMPTRKLGADVEGFGIVYLEAQARGVPAIAGEGLGVREALHEVLYPFAQDHTPETIASAVRAIEERPIHPERLRVFAEKFQARGAAKSFWKSLRQSL